MAGAIHDAGGRIFGEPFYWWGAHGYWQPLSPPAPSLGPSVRQFAMRDRTFSPRAMGRDEIREMIATIRRSVWHMREAGFDGVMLHGSHAALIQQFLSPYFNERGDEYGGGLENRMRFLIETLEAAREGTRGEMAVGLRFNCDELTPGGYDAAVAREVVGEIFRRGLIDYIDFDVGLEPQQLHLGMPTAYSTPQTYRLYIEAVRSAASVPVLSVLGRLTSMADAEAALARALEGWVRQLFPIGDALAARVLAAATYEGHRFARAIGEPGAPGTFPEAFFRAEDPARHAAGR